MSRICTLTALGRCIYASKAAAESKRGAQYGSRRAFASASGEPAPELKAVNDVRVTENLPQPADFLDRYQALVTLGKIRRDEDQLRVVMELRKLSNKLQDYSPPAFVSHYYQRPTPSTLLQGQDEGTTPWWFAGHPGQDANDPSTDIRAVVTVKTHAEELATLTTPKGLLLTGPPGSGKSFLVSEWFSAVPTRHKIRRHYSEFVLEVYRAVWEETQLRMAALHASPSRDIEEDRPQWTRAIRDRWRSLVQSGNLTTMWSKGLSLQLMNGSNAMEPSIAYAIARRLVLKHWLLVFDEVQLLDVSSAGLLADVLSWYWRMGGVVVGTSNKVPDDLYKNGVQRERLEPFVEALKARCPVLEMRSTYDWRRVRAEVKEEGGYGTWFTTGDAGKAEFERTVKQWTRSPGQPRELQSLGPADYLTLASTFDTHIIIAIPALKLSQKNQARRFISLIDALYEARCKLICQAETDLENLFFADAVVSQDRQSDESEDVHMDPLMAESVSETREAYRPNVLSYEEHPSQTKGEEESARSAPALETLSIFSGHDEQFAFKRALSRIYEMTSAAYAREDRWTPLPAPERKWEIRTPTRTNNAGSLATAPGEPTSPGTGTPSTHGNGGRLDMPQGAKEIYELVMPSNRRPAAPKLKDEHVWGVREDWNEPRPLFSPNRGQRNTGKNEDGQ
ncbi:hypothetical protein PUNSTDRAFT_42810 [Punctularia strigosozonata HHB-11173 SS5]|uniref:uncharacterized protein n=1 Tax=Punctularia strigosozonata (strain HHB-11173) TaxID=741275 RepID=UPI00044166C4|nr:uncharacterized protein PUNSTDRAFT_42810 [Punctularia strigosozonata HHB-11173 SS5]EIN11605.1 hypothetical protein PUNSTDRAFT_42810 [Punctularia strigosozonata HHB-11173 SS5]